MPDKAWKKRERDVAQYFNGKRTPLSGGNGKVTRADVIHEDLFIECKLRAKHTAISLWDDTAKLAKEEGIFAGNSCGAAIAGMIQLKSNFKKGQVVVVLLHDSGSRYIGKIYNDEWMKDKGFI